MFVGSNVGEFCGCVPRVVVGNVYFRRWLLVKCVEEEWAREAVMEMCRRDILFFLDAMVWQFNPNAVGEWSRESGPFVGWGYQEEALREIVSCIEGRRDLVVEKSREMGASWLFLVVMVWYVLFHHGKQFVCMSKDADAVDCASPNSLFYKFDYILEHLPDWMKVGVVRRKMYWGVESRRSGVTGVASTGDAAVSGRATAILVDEFTLMRHDFLVLHRTANTTGCRIFNGTHRGPGTALAELVDSGSAASGYVKKLQMHWSMHPDKRKGLYRWDAARQQVEVLDESFAYPAGFDFVKDGRPLGGPYPGLRSPWYDEMCGRIGSARGVAMELDMDVTGSVEQLFSVGMIRDLIREYARKPEWEGEVVLGEDGRTLSWYEKSGGPMSLWCRMDREKRPPRGMYVLGVDPSLGKGATPACVTGLDGRTGEKVFSYVNSQIEATPLGYLVVGLCNWFVDQDGGGAYLIWEIQGPGAMFGQRVMESGYRRVFYRRPHPSKAPSMNVTPGWNSNSDSKYNLLLGYQDGLRGGLDGRFLNRSKEALLECLNFNFVAGGKVQHSGEASPNDLSAARENHGDRVIADALAWKYAVELKRLARPGVLAVPEEVKVGTFAWRKMLAAQAGGSERRPWAS